MPSIAQHADMPKQSPPPDDAGVQKAKDDWRAERIRLGLSLNPDGPAIRLGPVVGAAFAREQLRENDAKRAEAIETLTLIVNEYGADRVGVWVDNIAKVKGSRR